MNYKPVTAVWEITMGCNMRCKHCGSTCTTSLPDELTTQEALILCDELGRLGFLWITLSGGEPFTRPDWFIIAEMLHKNSIITNIISNGWLFDEEILGKAVASHVNTIAFCLDGLRDTHDSIRKPESFDRIMDAFDLMRNGGIHRSVITTVNKKNISELPVLLKILEGAGVESWQLQLGFPMGTMALNPELVADPSCIDAVIGFAHAHYNKTSVDIQLADCIGYFNAKEMEVRQKGNIKHGYDWQGCGAGKNSMGILHNGDIVGCTSLRGNDFIEGSIRETSLQQIWDNPNSFKWNRALKKEQLSGFCSKCKYGATCLGGCGNTRLTMSDSIYGENRYCSYSYAISIAEEQFEKVIDIFDIAAMSRIFVEKGDLQLAESLLRRGLVIENGNQEFLRMFGFVSYMLGNYFEAKGANEKLLLADSNNPYANKGMGLSLCKLGRTDEAIAYLRRATELIGPNFVDPYHDLELVFMENGQQEEHLCVLDERQQNVPDYIKKSKVVYENVNSEQLVNKERSQGNVLEPNGCKVF